MKRNHATYVYEIAEILSDTYKDFNHYNRKNPLDELLFIICSVKRSEVVYLRAFRSLKQAFPKFEHIAEASLNALVTEVAWGGLQNQKAASVKALMAAILERFRRPSLTELKNMKDDDCEQFLSSLPGVGKKVARCVMLYSLDRKVFPVDTHCWRIAQRLGWLKASGSSSNCSLKDMDRLQEKIPLELRLSLHVNMVSHGRAICVAGKPKCSECVVIAYCQGIGLGKN